MRVKFGPSRIAGAILLCGVLALSTGCAQFSGMRDAPEPSGTDRSNDDHAGPRDAGDDGPQAPGGPKPDRSVIKVFDPLDAEAERERYRRTLLAGGLPALDAGERGYYLDVLQARLIQELASTDITFTRADTGFLISLPAQATFASGRVSLRPEAGRVLASIREAIGDFDRTLVSIHGHADATGPEEVNRRMSERRAVSVGEELVRLGLDARRVVAFGHGSAQPVASNETEAGRARNRRVELHVEALVR